ncbi:MAG TPA: hypothetical protein VED20_02095, partial [Streptosporangiaceae bacterium]|nr:hypothetical protein [Streptosporangiaceae bacterium]
SSSSTALAAHPGRSSGAPAGAVDGLASAGGGGAVIVLRDLTETRWPSGTTPGGGFAAAGPSSAFAAAGPGSEFLAGLRPGGRFAAGAEWSGPTGTFSAGPDGMVVPEVTPGGGFLACGPDASGGTAPGGGLAVAGWPPSRRAGG